MIPEIDSTLGILVYTTGFTGTSGTIRNTPDNFWVCEVISDSALKSIQDGSGYAVYLLKKKNIDTAHALSLFHKKTGIRLKSLGLKDASAVTEQFVCSYGKRNLLENFSTSKFSLKRLGFTKRPLSKKDMIGNKFRIRVSGTERDLRSFTEHNKILNFYGYQRFGSKRPVTHLVGKAILNRDFGRAVQLILSHPSKYDSTENSEIREKLTDKANYQKFLDQVPSWMDIERIVLLKMIAHDDPMRAIRAIPISLRRFYVQAYQSYLFNCTLSKAFSHEEELFSSAEGDVCFDSNGIIRKYAQGTDQYLAMPFVGYSYYKKTRFHHYISKILADEEISPKDFFLKEMQEVSSEGGFRQCAIRCSRYSVDCDIVEFTLSRGSFATILLREIMKPADPILAGF